jgi:peptidase M28-like protein
MLPAARRLHLLLCGALAVVLCAVAVEPPRAEWMAALDRISAASLRGHLSFLASDALEGRKTPSRGLDLAAEYIAAQFRRAGLEAPGDDGYFQTATMTQVEPPPAGIELKLENGSETMVAAEGTATARSTGAAELAAVPVFKMTPDTPGPKAEEVKGHAVVLAGRVGMRALAGMRRLRPAAIVTLSRSGVVHAEPHLVDPAQAQAQAEIPSVSLSDPAILEAMDALQPGPSDWKLSLRIPPARETPVKVRNVIGLLRGSDPALKDTYVLLTAHYDHLGVAADGRIYNGANDDGSGTVSVIEIASALAKLPQHPKRSIIFIALFGEEEGLLGSDYYVRHPLFALKHTVADINLEQLGRTDSSEGPEIANATFTGFEYSDLPAVFQKAGAMTGVKVYEAHNGGDEYFARSDNQSFAGHGIPAHTVVVAFDFPDYHGLGDQWTKVDYDNMTKVDRMLALGMLLVADDPRAPKWNADKAGRFAHPAGN